MNVLFIDTVHPILRETLLQKNYSCTDGTKMTRSQILSEINNYHGVVIRSKFKIDEEFLKAATSLQFIARSGAGLENINLDLTKKNQIKVFNSPEGNRDAVGEQALAMLLSLFNNLNRADREVRNGIWEREGNRGIELKGKTVGIIGYGNMGKAFAQRLSGFECTVLAFDKYAPNCTDEYATAVQLNEIFKRADIVSLHIPLTQETEFLANDSFFNSFQKEIYVINTARGKIVKTEALVKGLESGKIKGACLDVLEFEKTSFENLSFNENKPKALDYLHQSNKVILSPHIAGWTKESYEKLSSFLAEKIIRSFGTF